MRTHVGCPDPSLLDALALPASTGGRSAVDASGVRAIEAHVDTCASCAETLAQLLHLYGSGARERALTLSSSADRLAFARTVSAQRVAAPASTLRATIGRYRVLGVLGEGAMGAVYVAHDPELDRPVALKVLHADPFTDPSERRARLTREAQAMARLAHPNVVAVYDVGVDPATGQLYVAMERVVGTTLTGWLHRSAGGATRSERAILDAFVQAARGLAAAHAAGLVHRDFKPDNVLVGDDGRVRVGDFGLARGPDRAPLHAVGADGSTRVDVPRTAQGALVGTPAYMAPEQLRGNQADARSDQFAFAVALFEALTGVRPFEGRTLRELAENVFAARVHPRMSERPVWQRALLLRALSLDPARRFPSMNEVIAELSADRRSSRRPLVIGGIAAAIAVAATAIGVGIAVTSKTPSRQERRAASTTAPLVAGAASFESIAPPSPGARAEVDAIRSELARIDHDPPNYSAEPVKAAVDALVTRARAAGYDPVVAESLVVLARVERALERPKQAKDALEEAANIARATRYDALLYDVTIDMARLLGIDLGEAKESETWIGFAEAEAARHPDDRARRATLDLTLAAIRKKGGKLDDAAKFADHAVTLRSAAFGDDAIELAEALVVRSEIARARKVDAITDARKAQAIAMAHVVTQDGPERVPYDVALGEALLDGGAIDEAIAVLDRAVDTAGTFRGGRSPLALRALDARARAARAKGDATGARTAADRASIGMLIEATSGKLSVIDPTGSARTSGAIDFAAKIRGKVEKPDDTHHVSEENALACARAVEGNEAGALAALQTALDHAASNPALVGGTLGALHHNRAVLLARAGDYAAASAEIDVARQLIEREVGIDHIRFGLVELTRARILRKLGSPTAADVAGAAARILAARRGDDDDLVRAAQGA